MKGWGMQRIVQGRDLELHNIVVQNRAPIIVSLHNGTAERRGRPPGGERGYSHTLHIRVCAAQRGRDFEAPDLERGIHFRGVF